LVDVMTKLDAQIHLEPACVLVKFTSTSDVERRRTKGETWGKRRRRENGGAVGADSFRPEDWYNGQ